MKQKRYMVTAALPYANGPLHIGHLAGAYLPSDIYCRHLRSAGEDVLYICGSDEHGTAIAIKAMKEQTTPKAIIDRYHTLIKDTFEQFSISFDHYARTSNPVHHETASNIFKMFLDENLLVVEESEQPYDEQKGVFLADRYIMGTCPNCSSEKAYGNQCEKCGKDLSPSELINPKSTLSGSTPVWRSTKHWYMPLERYQAWLEQYILEDHGNWKTNVLGQCRAWLQDGLRPRAITRDLDWGVKVPVEGADGKVLYVWFDAPIGYISATIEWALKTGKDWQPYWKDKDTNLVHFIGKDNIVFHCIIFPCILRDAGFIVPENVPANEFLNLEGDKISTSRDWAVWMHRYLEDFPGKVDVLRYVLTAIMPETKDADFTWTDFQTRNNKELVDTFANFVNRVKVLVLKNFEGVPERLELDADEEQSIRLAHEAVQRCAACITQYRFKEALNEMMEIARIGDRYLSSKEPWHLVKHDKARAGHVLNVGLNIAAILAVASEPFMPSTSAQILKMLQIDSLRWKDLQGFDFVKAGGAITDIPHLFTRIEDSAIQAQVNRLKQRKSEMEAQENAKAKPFKSSTTFDDFQKMDIRIGTILSAEKVEKSKKLLKLLVDTGLDQRVILSGVAEHFSPEELVGKQCTVLANLEPRAIMGIQSNGMVLFAEDHMGKLHLLNPGHAIDSGSTVN